MPTKQKPWVAQELSLMGHLASGVCVWGVSGFEPLVTALPQL